MKSKIQLLFFVSLFSMASCTSLKKLIYFQDENEGPIVANKVVSYVPIHTMAVGDIISLNINTPLQTSAQILSQGGGTFTVKGDSTIEIPVIGTIKIAGLTTADAKDTLMKRARVYFNQPYVNFQLISFRVTVLGEINGPGIKALIVENATLIDAIASSGDLTNVGNRTNIKVLRGDKVFYLDITDINIFKSEGFYLQSNDIIYVEPLRKKNTLSNLSSILTVTSFVSVFITLATTIILLSK